MHKVLSPVLELSEKEGQDWEGGEVGQSQEEAGDSPRHQLQVDP